MGSRAFQSESLSESSSRPHFVCLAHTLLPRSQAGEVVAHHSLPLFVVPAPPHPPVIDMCRPVHAIALSLIATLPALASFAAMSMHFEDGSEETLQQWQALTILKPQQLRNAKRKAQQLGEAETEEPEQEVVETKAKEEEADDSQECAEAELDWEVEDPNDPLLPQKHSALLLFLHALASKPSLVHLELAFCGLTPFVLEHMPVWPNLLSLNLHCNKQLNAYRFGRAVECFPSVMSFTTPKLLGRGHRSPRSIACAGGAALPRLPGDGNRRRTSVDVGARLSRVQPGGKAALDSVFAL